MNISTYTITPQAPYRFDFFRERIVTSSNSYLYDIGDQHLGRAHLIDGHHVFVRVSCPNQGSDAPEFHLHVEGAPDEAVAEKAMRLWRHMLSLDRPLYPFYAKMSGDPVLCGIIDQLSGLNLLLEADPFESMILSIIGQQVNLTFAENLKRALVELCGTRIELNGRSVYAFPTPEQIARLQYEDLRPLKYSQRKAEYIIDFARGVVNGEIDLAALEQMDNDEAIATLVKLRGIGRWTAECVLLFGLGRPDLLPAADIGLRNAIQHFYGLDHQPTEPEVRERATAWAGYESYVTYYLWTALGLAKAQAKKQKSTGN
ncbi:DNA-3-methyladenine glycosylase family protein [Tumebacillus permanentifrigoris]|uniref:DNA-3-methyladenine glycosylase II n=1 Tax=Tumebacillus permanentifrigoris TaxID=378543 RepID=A0A316DX26_9BACL|nr:DNA-3-methyladenine glycosylase [Tumebacillus permanentifrigoris]PWK14394.1 DNA-3-methyladenine glycosylase II [Tumebacillus permanentifrigoris]